MSQLLHHNRTVFSWSHTQRIYQHFLLYMSISSSSPFKCASTVKSLFFLVAHYLSDLPRQPYHPADWDYAAKSLQARVQREAYRRQSSEHGRAIQETKKNLKIQTTRPDHHWTDADRYLIKAAHAKFQHGFWAGVILGVVASVVDFRHLPLHCLNR